MLMCVFVFSPLPPIGYSPALHRGKLALSHSDIILRNDHLQRHHLPPCRVITHFRSDICYLYPYVYIYIYIYIYI